MGKPVITKISSPSNEKAFLTLVYDYMMSLYSGITCDVIDNDGVTVLGHDVDAFIWNTNKPRCNMDFTLDTNVKLRFQTYPGYAQSNLRSSGYNVYLIYENEVIMMRGDGNTSTRYYNSGCFTFGNQDSNGDVVATAYTNNPRTVTFTKYIDDNMFILWGTSYFGTPFGEDPYGFSIMKLRGLDEGGNDIWYWGGNSNPNPIENCSFYGRGTGDKIEVSKSSMFTYEAKMGYLDFISHSNFNTSGIKAFANTDIYDSTTVATGDTYSVDNGVNFLAIGAHSLVRLDV